MSKRIFISYARKDGRELALWLQTRLAKDGYEVWLDTSEIEGGASWSVKIEQAIDAADIVLALMSRGSYVSEICRAEHLRALRQRKHVIPLLVQADAERPLHLESLNYRDFSAAERHDETFTLLHEDITSGRRIEVTLTRRGILNAPALNEKKFVPRPAEFEQLKQLVLSDSTDRKIALSALRGMGGIGKSVLALALCHDETVQDAFPDGVVWVDVGRENVILSDKLKAVALALNDHEGDYGSLDTARTSLRKLLPDRAALIVLDDVWDSAHVRPFLVDAPRSRVLFTTRDGKIAADVDADELNLSVMQPEQAVDLLRQYAERDEQEFPQIAKRVDYLPLALKLVGARLRDNMPAAEWLATYERVSQIKAGRRPQTAHESIALCFDLSVDVLGEDRPLYHALGIFPEDEWIPQAAITRLWRRQHPDLSASDCADLLGDLERAALVERQADGAVQMHDLLHSYNREKLAEDYVLVQAALLAAYNPANEPWAEVIDDGYLFAHIGYHLMAAGRHDELRTLLLDYPFLQAKLNATDINALIADCDLLKDDEVVGLVRSALTMSRHVLRKDEAALAHQLVGRLMPHRAALAAIRSLVDEIVAMAPGIYPVNLDSTYNILEPAGGALLAVFEGHTENIMGVLVDETILSWSRDGTLRRWDVYGAPLVTFEGHTRSVYGAQTLTDGSILSWSGDRTLRWWSNDGTLLVIFEGHTGGVSGALVLTDGSMLSWSEDKTLRRWQEDGTLLAAFEGHTGGVSGALILTDGSILSWARDRTLRRWDVNGTLLAAFEGHTGGVSGALILTDGSILSWARDRTLRRWDVNGTLLTAFEGHINYVNGALVLEDGTILSWAWDRTLRRWDVDGTLLATYSGHIGGVTCAMVLGNGSILAWGDANLRCWAVDGTLLATFKGHNDWVLSALELTDGSILSWSRDGTLRRWVVDGTLLTSFKGHTRGVNGALELTDGSILSWSDDHTLRRWQMNFTEVAAVKGHADEVWGALKLADGSILSWAGDKTLRRWDVNGALLASFEGHTAYVYGAIALADGSILSWSGDHTLRRWDVDGALLASFEGHADEVWGALELADGTSLSWSLDYTLRRWGLDGMLMTTIEDHRGVECVLLLADGSILSWSGRNVFLSDNTLHRWDVGGALLASFEGHIESVWGAMALADGSILSWAGDNTLRRWDVGGALLASFEGHIEPVKGVVEMTDGAILSWAGDNTLRRWDVDGALLAVFEGHSGEVNGALELAGDSMLSWSEDKTLQRWDIEGHVLAMLDESYKGDKVRIFAWAQDQGFDANVMWPEADEPYVGVNRVMQRDNTILVYSTQTGETLARFVGDARITCLAVTGDVIVAGDVAGRVLFLRYTGNTVLDTVS